MNCHDVVQRIMSLGALSNWVVLMGSASAMMRFPNFRRARDIDLVVHPVIFLLLCVFRPSGWEIELPKIKGWRSFYELRLKNKHLNMEMFMRWRTGRGYIPYRELKESSTLINGVECTSIKEVLSYKLWLRRAKDVADINQLKGILKKIATFFKKVALAPQGAIRIKGGMECHLSAFHNSS